LALTDLLFTRYDVPKSSIAGEVSTAFTRFVTDVFVYQGRDGPIDAASVAGLSPSEVELAKDLIRRNLHLGYSHLLQAAAALQDQGAVPQLEALLAQAGDLGRRVGIARSLLTITGDRKYEQAVREWEELGPDKQRQLIEESPAFQAAMRSMRKFQNEHEQERAEMIRANRGALRHSLTVLALTATALALIAAAVWFFVIR